MCFHKSPHCFTETPLIPVRVCGGTERLSSQSEVAQHMSTGVGVLIQLTWFPNPHSEPQLSTAWLLFQGGCPDQGPLQRNLFLPTYFKAGTSVRNKIQCQVNQGLDSYLWADLLKYRAAMYRDTFKVCKALLLKQHKSSPQDMRQEQRGDQKMPVKWDHGPADCTE